MPTRSGSREFTARPAAVAELGPQRCRGPETTARLSRLVLTPGGGRPRLTQRRPIRSLLAPHHRRARDLAGVSLLGGAILVLLGGCGAAVFPRLGTTLPKGAWSIEEGAVFFLYSRGTVELELDGGRRSVTSGNTGSPEAWTPTALLPLLAATGRQGVTDWLELGAEVALFLRVAGEARVALLREARGAPCSLAWAAALGYQPFYGRHGPWLRTGFDLSRALGPVQVVLNLALSRGEEAHGLEVDVPLAAEDLADGLAVAYVVRPELRGTALLAVGWEVPQADGPPFHFHLGVAPYVTLWHGAATLEECSLCAGHPRLVRFEEDWGLALLFGLAGKL